MNNFNIDILRNINPAFKTGNNPKKWYHGTPAAFDKFDIDYTGSNIGSIANTSAGFWFSDSRQTAKRYANIHYDFDSDKFPPGVIKEVNIAAKNIIDINLYGQHPDDFMLMPDNAMYKKLKKRGFNEWDIADAIKYSKKNGWTPLTNALRKYNKPIFFIECTDHGFWNLTKEYDAILFRNSSETYHNNNDSYVIVNNTSLITDAKENKTKKSNGKKARMRCSNNK